MKTKTCLYLAVLLLTLSCQEFLNIKPYGKTIPKTAEEFSALIHKHLNDIENGSDGALVGNASRWISLDTGCGNDFENCLTSGGARLPIYMGDVIGGSQDIYSNLYQAIRDCNIVLNEMEEKGSLLSDKLRATAHALRGVAYFQLLRMFCEAPEAGNFDQQNGLSLILSFDMEARTLRSSLQQSIDQIEDDFRKSLSYQLEDPVFLFTQDVVKGYMARLYFWTEAWEQALPLARELLKKYPLLEGEAYEKMMTTAFDRTGNQLLKSYSAISSGNRNDLNSFNSSLSKRPVSRRFLDSFSAEEKNSDIRYKLWVNPQRQAIKSFFCGMRTAEFKLIEAECLYHLQRPEAALQSINELRAKRIGSYTPLTEAKLPPPADTEIIRTDASERELSPLMALILRERRKELFLEGDRFFEQKRNGSPEYWTAHNGLKYTNRKFMYTFPIPIQDIETVKGLQQNPGYKDLTSN